MFLKIGLGLLNVIIRLCLLYHALQFVAEASLAIVFNISHLDTCAVSRVFLLHLKLAGFVLCLKQILNKHQQIFTWCVACEILIEVVVVIEHVRMESFTDDNE